MARTRVDRVGVARRLVGPVPLHAREPERDAARIARARLDSVEGDLDDELRPDVDDVAVRVRLEPEQVLRLPREHLVRQALERLAQHHEAARRGIARAEVEIRQLAPSAARAPTPRRARRGRACATGLTLSQPAPRRPASYGASSDLTITPSCPRASASSRNACAASASSVSRRGTTSSARQVARRAPRAARRAGASIRSSPSTWRQSKKNADSGAVRAQLGDVRLRPEAAHRHLERLGAAVLAERDRLAVEHDAPTRRARARPRRSPGRDR